MPVGLAENSAVARRLNLGRTLKHARQDAKLKQWQLAERVRTRGGVLAKTNPQTISDIERNVQTPRPELLVALCEELHITSLPVHVMSLTPPAALESPVGNQIESPASNPQQLTERRSAESSVALAPLPPSVTPPAHDDVLTDEERAMLTTQEQSLVRRFRSANPEDRQRIDRLIDAVLIAGEERATGADEATSDPLAPRFRGR